MTMRLTTSLCALALIVLPSAIGCSHDDDHHGDHNVARTSGAERDHDRARVATRDTDHDGTADTVAVRDESPPTALDQGESASDVEITRQIRAAVVADSSLSFGARNCVIITRDGDVMLRGDVTGAESDAIERHAQTVAGVTHVTNALNVTDQVATD
jgi:hypothetical protein